MPTPPSAIVPFFLPRVKVLSVEPSGSGHINDSFRVVTSAEADPDFFIQKINHLVFSDIEGLMQNISMVTGHLRSRLRTVAGTNGWQTLEIIPACDGRLYYQDGDGFYWRMYRFIPDSFSYDKVESPWLARQGGKAFGTFMKVTADLDPANLTVTIPRFHDLEWRMEQFDTSLREDLAGRVTSSLPEIRFAKERAETMLALHHLILSGNIPVRLTHNDTKFNNILFDKENRPVCIVDLDTVMPGSVLYDFGDAIRTGASTASEDEADTSLVGLDPELYRAYSEGFMEAAGIVLTPEERENMGSSARFMTYLIGLRFLTDHLQGDTYYKIRFPGHNLIRARNQFALLADMETKRILMDEPFLNKPIKK